MPDFDSVESGTNQRFQSLASASFGRVRPDREGASFVRHRDRILDCEDILRHKSAAAAAQIAHECVAEIVNRPSGNHGPGDVGPADRATFRLQKNFVERERYAEGVELFNDFLGASEALRAQLAKSPF